VSHKRKITFFGSIESEIGFWTEAFKDNNELSQDFEYEFKEEWLSDSRDIKALQNGFFSWSYFDQCLSSDSDYFGFSVSSAVKQVHYFDYFKRHGEHIDAYNLLQKSFRETVLSHSSIVDNRRPAFFIGDGPFFRTACSALIMMGFSKFYICSPNFEKVRNDVEFLKKSFFGIDFSILSTEEVTQLKDPSSIVVNLLKGDVKVRLNEDLSYFNYLQLTGVVFDLYSQDDQRFYVEEAQRAGLVVIETKSIFENILKNMTRV
jgi:hypothetical protein